MLSEIHNSEIVVLWLLEPFDFYLEAGEGMMHIGDKVVDWPLERYNLNTFVKLNKDKELEITKWESEYVNGTVEFKPREKILITKDDEVIIQKWIDNGWTFEVTQEIKMTQNDEIELTTSQGGIVQAQIKLNPDWTIDIVAQSNINIDTVWNINANVNTATITATNKITLAAPLVEVV